MMPGMPEKRTHDYARNGITSLLAALDMASGNVIGALHRRHRSTEYRTFLIRIDKAVPAELDVHIICDDYATHKPTSSNAGSSHTPASTCISSRPAPPGSIRSNDGSANSPPNCSNEAPTKASKPSKPTSAPGSKSGTKTPALRVTKTADEILDNIATFCKRTSGAGHWTDSPLDTNAHEPARDREKMHRLVFTATTGTHRSSTAATRSRRARSGS
jgi:hypothetical protein